SPWQSASLCVGIALAGEGVQELHRTIREQRRLGGARQLPALHGSPRQSDPQPRRDRGLLAAGLLPRVAALAVRLSQVGAGGTRATLESPTRGVGLRRKVVCQSRL